MRTALLVVLAAAVILSSCPKDTAPPDTIQPPDNKVQFCGTSTNGPCESDNDCRIGGCSAQVCESTKEESTLTTCEYRECYDSSKYGLSCRCIENMCRWA